MHLRTYFFTFEKHLLINKAVLVGAVCSLRSPAQAARSMWSPAMQPVFMWNITLRPSLWMAAQVRVSSI